MLAGVEFNKDISGSYEAVGFSTKCMYVVYDQDACSCKLQIDVEHAHLQLIIQ